MSLILLLTRFSFSVMAFMLGLPVGQIILFCTAIGRDPVGLTLAVTNHELSNDQFSHNECPVVDECYASYDASEDRYTPLMSCWYLDFLKKRNKMNLVSDEFLQIICNLS